MKKVLIIGKNSYVGISVGKWLENYPERYSIDSISVRDDSWKGKDFSGYDAVFHVAGIAHIKETNENAHLYYKVNRDLAYEVAQKAKTEGVSQFIFLSSMSVYGLEFGVIDKSTPLNPTSNYGKSKLQAEDLIQTLSSTNFKVCILRPPMIYGKGCKGNYQRLTNLVLKLPLFPDIYNQRSMIYIDNLCEFIKVLIDNGSKGLYLPQNQEYVCTSEMVKLIAEAHGKRVWMTKLFNPIIKYITISTLNKLFGDLVYKEDITGLNDKCYMVDFKESIGKSSEKI